MKSNPRMSHLSDTNKDCNNKIFISISISFFTRNLCWGFDSQDMGLSKGSMLWHFLWFKDFCLVENTEVMILQTTLHNLCLSWPGIRGLGLHSEPSPSQTTIRKGLVPCKKRMTNLYVYLSWQRFFKLRRHNLPLYPTSWWMLLWDSSVPLPKA